MAPYIRLARTTLYGQSHDGNFQFRIYLTGDTAILSDKSVFSFQSNGKSFPIAFAKTLAGSAFIANCVCKDAPIGEVTLDVDGRTKFKVITRER